MFLQDQASRYFLQQNRHRSFAYISVVLQILVTFPSNAPNYVLLQISIALKFPFGESLQSHLLFSCSTFYFMPN